METPESPPAPVQSPHVGRIVSSDSVPAGGFTPGTILADRYRIIGLLGRGGMGEVYRADDLKLGQSVALKFLPPKLAEDPVRREHFFAEVRITRQLSHPNICRVYDIGDVDMHHFLSMEYIDGEDLASLMKRIGHLSNEKALDIARQLVAGLTVAHERGVLHRDLKPANIMLDGHGRVRITDFGLAIAAEDESQAEEIAGTPAYMAPEQLAGKGATVRSDIYSLGLILYEIYTGKKAFKAKTLAELREQKETQTPRAPSELRDGIDPVVERVIQRCMEKDPNARPASVAQLAQALPGGDPLAAAIAAGETPSPEMVAASGSTEGLKPWIAWVCLALFVLGTGSVVLLPGPNRFMGGFLHRVPIERPPEVLVQTARDILLDSGYTDPPADSAFKFEVNTEYLQDVEKNDRSPKRFEKMPALAIQIWYRQSPNLLLHTAPASEIALDDPPFTNYGESIVWLDARGRLTGLRVIPPEKPVQNDAVRSPDWSMLFEAAGLDENIFTEAETESIPPLVADTRAAWTGVLPDFPDTAVRIEAAAWKGKPVFWRMKVLSWDDYSTADLPSGQVAPGTGSKAIDIIGVFLLILVLMAGPAYFAQRNLRMGRGDRRGANRLAFFIFSLLLAVWVFHEHHIASTMEVVLFLTSAAYSLLMAGWIWLLYIALEPYARRRWPGFLVGWSRLLAGNYRDPLVGRDLLIGFSAAAVCMVIIKGHEFVYRPLNIPQFAPYVPTLAALSGFHKVLARLLNAVVSSLVNGLAYAFIISFMKILFRRTWIAAVVPALLFSLFILMTTWSILDAVAGALFLGSVFFVCLRFGLLPMLSFVFFIIIYITFPIGAPLSTWYFKIGLTGLAVLAAFALYAFRISLGGRPMFGTPRLDE